MAKPKDAEGGVKSLLSIALPVMGIFAGCTGARTSGWLRGPWDNEPDKIQFKDETTGLPALVVRNPRMGFLCGYVGIDRKHPAFGKDSDRLSDLEVHGGLTFADRCQPGPSAQSVCHIVEAGEDDDIWWLGFDCGHAFDLAPGLEGRLRGPVDALNDVDRADLFRMTYRDVAYVRSEIASLAQQLRGLEAQELPNG